MVFRNEAPVSAVCAVVSVVAHHPEIVHFESVEVSLLSIDEDATIAHFEGITFEDFDDAPVKREVVQRELHGGAFGGDGEGAEIIDGPIELGAMGEEVAVGESFLCGEGEHLGDLLVINKTVVHCGG